MDDPVSFEKSSRLKVKPLCKPNVHLKKSRQRMFDESSIDLIYSFGYQCIHGPNLCSLKNDIIILVAGNYLNLLNIDTLEETFVPSVYGTSFTCVTAHPSTYYFAAGEKGENFCINVFSYPEIEACKLLKDESSIMPSRVMQFHPQGDLLVALSFDPENKIYIWHWQFESVLYISDDSTRPIHSMHFSAHDENTFLTSGEGHVTFWGIDVSRNERDIISEIVVTQQEELFLESPKLDIYCTVSISDTFLSATAEGCLLLWNAEWLTFNSSVKILMPDDKCCHDTHINHIITLKNFIITLGSDGYIKVWDYDEIESSLKKVIEDEDSVSEEETEKIEDTESTESNEALEIIHIDPVANFLINENSDLVYGIINEVKHDHVSYIIQDKNGLLFQVVIASDLSDISVRKLLCGPGTKIVGLSVCPLYPLVAAASAVGNVSVYDCVDKKIFKFGCFPVSVTSLYWPSAKLDIFASSFFIGFLDGTIKWIAFSNDTENFILKFAIKPHTNAVEHMKANDCCSTFISQALDSKLFFYSVENFSLTPIGFYINRHEVIDFAWLKYFRSSTAEKPKETLLILCKYSYIIETEIPDAEKYLKCSEVRKTYYIENSKYQVYKIDGLRKYHKLGDRIYDSDCEELPDLNEAEKEVLCKLKYEEKRETRESRRAELGLSGSITPSEILSYLPSASANCLWLSLGKEDFGYIFEFEFQGQFSLKPLTLTPIRALEVLTAEIIPIISMQYSPCGKFILMGLEDGSLNICYLDEAFKPESGYDFAKYQSHDPHVSGIKFIKILSGGSFIATAGYDGNVLVFEFHKFGKAKEYGEKPACSDIDEVEDISIHSPSLEEKVLKEMSERYNKMKECRVSAIEKLKQDYLTLKEQYIEYSNLCKSSLEKLQDVPQQLHLNFEKYSFSLIAAEKFTETTRKLLKDIDIKYEESLIKSKLLYEKYFKYFKSRIEYENFTVNIDENVSLSTFQGCFLPSNLQNIQMGPYPKMYKPKEKTFTEGRKKSDKVWEERIKLEHQLLNARKAIIDYPDNTPVSDIISKYNKRKYEQIEILKEHIAEFENLESLRIDDKMYKEVLEEIEACKIKFISANDADQCESQYACTFAEKKAKTAIYCKKMYDFWKMFNNHVLMALEYPQTVKEPLVDSKITSNSKGSQLIDKHIYFLKGDPFGPARNSMKIQWTFLPSNDNENIIKRKCRDDELLDIKTEKKLSQQRVYSNLLSVLRAIKPKVSCEKKYHDTRFVQKCIELNIFKTELLKEKRWLKIITELQEMLNKEELELSNLEDEINVLQTKRESEKREWISLYKEFYKTIGSKHKHKGYLKQIFKKKIRPGEEKEPYKRNASSESSESEEDIHSEDDDINTDPKDVDQNLLKKVMHFRLKRQDIENKMKEYKRSLLALVPKQAAFQRRIHRIKDSLNEAWSELSSIPDSRKVEYEKMYWHTVLYPENVHKDFFNKCTVMIPEQEVKILNEMSSIHEKIVENLKPINKLIQLTILKLIDKVVDAELKDLIDIACSFFPMIDTVVDDTEKYFKTLRGPDSSEILKKKIEEKESKPVNIIQEILSGAVKEDHEIIQSEDSGTSSESLKSTETGTKYDSKEKACPKTVETSLFQSSLSVEDFEDTQVAHPTQQKVFRHWREICKEFENTPTKMSEKKEIDIKSLISNAVPPLDESLFEEVKLSSVEDYYMQPPSFSNNALLERTIDQPDLTFYDLTEMLFELDVKETIEYMLRKVTEEEQILKDANKFKSDSFPTYPGGGLFLTRDVLLAMEHEDPESFPYTDFYHEISVDEERFEKPKLEHIKPHFKEMKTQYSLSEVSFEDFVLLNMNDILDALKSYNEIKASVLDYGEKVRNLEKKVSKAIKKRVNVEQKVLAVSRERLDEMKKKFSQVVDLDHLLDIIENPHLHIKRYEYNMKLDSLQKDLKKLKDSEVAALKSLDKCGFKDTVICQELLKLRQEFKFLNKKYSSKLQKFPS